jgi:hypothetical protein
MKITNKYLVSALLCLALLLSLLTGCGSNDYVVKIGSSKISKGEFMVYLKEQKKSFEQQAGADIWDADFDDMSAIDVAKQNAVNTLVMVKSAVKEAESLGIKLDDSDLTGLDEEADGIMSEFSSDELESLGLDREKVVEVLKEARIQSKVFGYITDSYVVNEDEFNKYYNDYKSEHSEEFNTYYVRELFLQRDDTGDTTNYDKAKYALEAIEDGEGFEQTAKETNPNGSYDTKVLDSSLYGEEALSEIYSIAVGDTKLVEDTEGYYVINMVDIQPKDETAVKEKLKAQYTDERKQEIYQQQSKTWVGNVETERNDSVWDSINTI